MPYLPQHHLPSTTGTNKGVIPAGFHYHLSIVLASYRKALPALGCIRWHYGLYFLSNFLIDRCCMQSIIPYPLHPFGQYVLQETPQKLLMRQRSCLLLVIVGVVFPLKGYVRIIDRDDSMVGYRNSMGIAGKILEYVFGPAEWWLGVDDPAFLQLFQKSCKRFRIN